MVPLREDGSLDMELLNKLPFDDYLEAVGSFLYQHLQEYIYLNFRKTELMRR